MRRRNVVGTIAVAALLGVTGSAVLLGACSGWDPREPFQRNAPQVDDAIKELDAGQLEPAEQVLEAYLGTGACSDAGIGLPDAVRQKPNGSFDLGLVLFYLAERYGQRFGDEELKDGGGADEQLAAQRSAEIDCALIVVKAIAADPSVAIALRARGYYLAGNLEFLRRHYEEAVRLYDEALKLIPGIHEEAGGDGIGRDAAWNRAIALRRKEDQKDAGQDASDAQSDASDGADEADAPDSADSGKDKPDSGNPPDGGKGDAGNDAGPDASNQDNGEDGGSPPPEPKEKPQPETPDQRQDDRMLDRLEEAPNYQGEEAKSQARTRRGRTMEDK